MPSATRSQETFIAALPPFIVAEPVTGTQLKLHCSSHGIVPAPAMSRPSTLDVAALWLMIHLADDHGGLSRPEMWNGNIKLPKPNLSSGVHEFVRDYEGMDQATLHDLTAAYGISIPQLIYIIENAKTDERKRETAEVASNEAAEALASVVGRWFKEMTYSLPPDAMPWLAEEYLRLLKAVAK